MPTDDKENKAVLGLASLINYAGHKEIRFCSDGKEYKFEKITEGDSVVVNDVDREVTDPKKREGLLKGKVYDKLGKVLSVIAYSNKDNIATHLSEIAQGKRSFETVGELNRSVFFAIVGNPKTDKNGDPVPAGKSKHDEEEILRSINKLFEESDQGSHTKEVYKKLNGAIQVILPQIESKVSEEDIIAYMRISTHNDSLTNLKNKLFERLVLDENSHQFSTNNFPVVDSVTFHVENGTLHVSLVSNKATTSKNRIRHGANSKATRFAAQKLEEGIDNILGGYIGLSSEERSKVKERLEKILSETKLSPNSDCSDCYMANLSKLAMYIKGEGVEGEQKENMENQLKQLRDILGEEEFNSFVDKVKSIPSEPKDDFNKALGKITEKFLGYHLGKNLERLKEYILTGEGNTPTGPFASEIASILAKGISKVDDSVRKVESTYVVAEHIIQTVEGGESKGDNIPTKDVGGKKTALHKEDSWLNGYSFSIGNPGKEADQPSMGSYRKSDPKREGGKLVGHANIAVTIDENGNPTYYLIEHKGRTVSFEYIDKENLDFSNLTAASFSLMNREHFPPKEGEKYSFSHNLTVSKEEIKAFYKLLGKMKAKMRGKEKSSGG